MYVTSNETYTSLHNTWAVPQLKRLVAGFPPRRPRFDPRSGHLGFVVGKVALGQVFSENFGFPCQSSFHRLLHNHHLSSGAGTIGQQWPTYQVNSVSPHPEKLHNTCRWHFKLFNVGLLSSRKRTQSQCSMRNSAEYELRP
jgi:hypothetical protein